MRKVTGLIKYKIDEEFFDTWSQGMAYILGFWFADGYMRYEKSYRIVFVSRDKDSIYDIRKTLSSTHPIWQRKDDKTWNIVIFSKYLYTRLQNMGGSRRKSKTIKFPDVPPQYLPDFIRGYFDGDGSVFYVRYISTKNHKTREELRSNFTSGSREFLNSLMHILNKEIGLSLKRLGVYNAGSSLKLGYGTYDTHKLLRFMYYPNHSLSLKRKSRFVQTLPAISLPQWKNQYTIKIP